MPPLKRNLERSLYRRSYTVSSKRGAAGGSFFNSASETVYAYAPILRIYEGAIVETTITGRFVTIAGDPMHAWFLYFLPRTELGNFSLNYVGSWAVTVTTSVVVWTIRHRFQVVFQGLSVGGNEASGRLSHSSDGGGTATILQDDFQSGTSSPDVPQYVQLSGVMTPDSTSTQIQVFSMDVQVYHPQDEATLV